MIKTAFLRILTAFGIILACAGFAFPVIADINISDNFDSYNNGDYITDLPWADEISLYNTCSENTTSTISDIRYYSGLLSLDITNQATTSESYYCSGFEFNENNDINSSLSFDFYIDGQVSGPLPDICMLKLSLGGTAWYMQFVNSYDECFADYNMNRVNEIPCGEWLKFNLILNDDNDYYDIYMDYEYKGHVSTSSFYAGNLDFNITNQLNDPDTCEIHIDNFIYINNDYIDSTSSLVNYSSFDFNSYFPDLCIHNEGTFEGTASGYIDMDDDSTLHFNKLILKAMDVGTRETYFASTTFPYIEAGDYYDFFIDYDFPTGTTYWVEYILSGYNKEDELTMGENVIYYIPQGSIDEIGDYDITCLTSLGNATGTSLDRIWTVPEPEDGLEDCSGLTFTETMLCEIRNSLIWALMPSPGKMEQLFARADDLKYKFPLNYINAVNYSLGFLNDNYSASTTATSTFISSSTIGIGLAKISYGLGQLSFFQLIRTLAGFGVIIFFGFIMIKMGLSLFQK